MPSFWLYRLPMRIFVHSGICVLILIAVAVVVALLIFRIAIQISLNLLNLPESSMLTAAAAGTLNVIFIFILNLIYDPFSRWLTDAEGWRTQSEFNRHFMLKIYLLRFVSYYTSLSYVAFFKAR